MTKQRPCVLVYNPISGHGHLDSWNALFVALLLERGFRVLSLTPDVAALEARLAQRKSADRSRLLVLDWHAPSTLSLAVRLRMLLSWWWAYGAAYANKTPETRAAAGMSLFVRAKKKTFQVLVPPLYAVTRALWILYCWAAGKGVYGETNETNYLEPTDTAIRIKAALKRSQWQPDCMFNMYMDMYKTGLNSWQEFAEICNLPWGGIRFVPSVVPPLEGYYALESLRGMCFLDETVCASYHANVPDKYFQCLPDITNVDLPEAPCFLTEEIRRRAAGRKIVFLGGSIGGQKNIARWCELITLADPQRWFFVQVGEVHANTFTEEDAIAFEKMRAKPPENLFLHCEYLPDERHFNAVVQLASVIFAVYRNFRISSNMLGKAAFFEKPIMVSDKFLLAERVRRFGIGMTAPEDDAQGMLEVLEQLLEKPFPQVKFAAYRAAFSEQKTGDSLEIFLKQTVVH